MLDNDYEEYMQFVVDKLLATDYEFLGLMDVDTGYLRVFGANKDANGMARNGSYYDDEMPLVFSQLLPEEYFAEGARTMARPHIIENLETQSCYTCSFPARTLGSTRAGRKQWKFVYLSDAKKQILMTRCDITDVFTAERDALTGLYNRQGFYRHARELLDANPQRRLVLVRCDIDRFKAYNDLCGTQAGDKLLAEFGRVVRRTRWAELTLFGRIEGDHFCALLPMDRLDVHQLGVVQEEWLKSVAPSYRVTSSIGIYEIVDPSIEISLMCDRALLALNTVKQSYAVKLAWYDDKLRSRMMSEQALVDEMEAALREGQFVLYFQPQVNYAQGTLVGAEALVRWQHPQRGVIGPGEFIPVFERNGFILKLDAYVWEKACQYLHSKLAQDKAYRLPLSVNISRYDIYDPALCARLHGLVQKYAVPPELLKLEITESAYMENPQQLVDVVKELKRLGFTVEMDDFGSGYSSLNTLKDVPVDVLKLDINFLSAGVDDARGGLILYSMIHMAHWLKLPVIAEGVETGEQADYLQGLSCQYMQGYHFGRPMPADEFDAFAQRSKKGEISQYDGLSLEDVKEIWKAAAPVGG